MPTRTEREISMTYKVVFACISSVVSILFGFITLRIIVFYTVNINGIFAGIFSVVFGTLAGIFSVVFAFLAFRAFSTRWRL